MGLLLFLVIMILICVQSQQILIENVILKTNAVLQEIMSIFELVIQ